MQNESYDERKMFIKTLLSMLLQFGADSVYLDTIKDSAKYHKSFHLIPSLELLVTKEEKMLSETIANLKVKFEAEGMSYVDVDVLCAELQNEITAKIYQKLSVLKALMRSLKVREEVNND